LSGLILPSLSFAPNSRVFFSPKCGGISGILLKLFSDFRLRAVTASEIEFYLFGSGERDLSNFWNDIKTACASAGIEIFKIEKERGREQHEISLTPSNPEKTVSDTNALKDIVSKISEKYGVQSSFAAKPLADDFGSGLHIHIHLEDEQGTNQFIKNDSSISDTLNHALGGLLLWLPDTMPIFAPNEESYKRFVAGSNGPLTVSWGANNRTVALRLPDSSYDNKRIEHRVAGADADVLQVMYVILAAIHYGLATGAKPDGQVYGDAALEMYAKPRFSNNLQVAKQRMQQSIFPLKNYGILIES
jgi:glutamine synthetase